MFSPQGLANRAALIVVAFAALHLGGARASTSFLSGTSPGTAAEGLLGGLYAICWFATVVGAPVLAIAAVVFAFLVASPRLTREAPPGPSRRSPAGPG
jgi:hypothetical protein